MRSRQARNFFGIAEDLEKKANSPSVKDMQADTLTHVSSENLCTFDIIIAIVLFLLPRAETILKLLLLLN